MQSPCIFPIRLPNAHLMLVLVLMLLLSLNLSAWNLLPSVGWALLALCLQTIWTQPHRPQSIAQKCNAELCTACRWICRMSWPQSVWPIWKSLASDSWQTAEPYSNLSSPMHSPSIRQCNKQSACHPSLRPLSSPKLRAENKHWKKSCVKMLSKRAYKLNKWAITSYKEESAQALHQHQCHCIFEFFTIPAILIHWITVAPSHDFLLANANQEVCKENAHCRRHKL